VLEGAAVAADVENSQGLRAPRVEIVDEAPRQRVTLVVIESEIEEGIPRGGGEKFLEAGRGFVHGEVTPFSGDAAARLERLDRDIIGVIIVLLDLLCDVLDTIRATASPLD